MSSEKVATMPQANPVMAPPPPPPLPPTSTKKKTSPPASSSSSPSPSSSTSPSVSPSSSSGAVPTKATPAAANPQLPPLVPVYTKPAILGLPPTAVLTKQEMDFRANLLNPNNDLFWTARGLIRPPVLADALAQGHAILKYEGHLTQKQGGRRLSAQYGRSGAASGGAAGMPLSFGAAVVTPTSVTSAVQGSWRSPAPVQLPTNPGFVTKEDMDIRANQLNPNNDVFWSSRGLIRPAVLADALAQGHAILQQEGHLTQTQTHKTRGRLNSQPSLYSNSDLGARPADTRRSISGQGLPGSGSGGIGSGAGRISGSRAGEGQQQQQPMAMRRRASTTGSIMNRPPALDGSVTKDEVDLRANLMNPNNSIFWTSRGLTRPTDLQEALAKGHAVLEAEGHVTHNTGGGRSKSWNRRGSRTELHAPPSVSPLVAAAQRQWSTPFLAPNAGITAMPPTSLSARPGGLPGAAWVAGPAAATGAASTRHPDWQPNAPQRRRYSLPPPGFELFTPPSHFALFRPPIAAQQQKPLQSKQAMPFAVKEGAADSEWDKMDAEAFSRPLAPHSAAIPIVKPTAADIAAAKKNESAWVKKAPSADSKKSTGIFLRDKSASSKEEEKTGDDKKKIEAETKAMKQEDKKEATASSDDSTKSDVETRDTVIPSAPTTPATAAATTSTSTSDKVGSLAWQLTQVKLRTRRPSEARESDISTKSATA